MVISTCMDGDAQAIVACQRPPMGLTVAVELGGIADW